MTTGELLDQSSSVSNVSALIHLQNLIGGGIDRFFPVTDINVEFEEEILKVNFEDTGITIKFEEQNLEVNFDEPILDVTFEEETNDINITC